MATCEKIEVKPVPPPVKYQLTLSETEAQFLFALLGRHIIGDGQLRDTSSRVYGALRAADVPRRVLRLECSHSIDGTPALRMFGWFA